MPSEAVFMRRRVQALLHERFSGSQMGVTGVIEGKFTVSYN
jgi:hypothetical protein